MSWEQEMGRRKVIQAQELEHGKTLSSSHYCFEWNLGLGEILIHSICVLY
jgi:hypothetical protein